jgi:PAS domain S-box-containing protein
MKNDSDPAGSPELRQKAESLLGPESGAGEDIADMSLQDIDGLIHELRVHQIELSMQNDELRRIQVELEKSRDRYEHLYDFAPAAYLTVDEKGMLLAANLTATALLGRHRADLVGRMFSSFVQREDQDIWYLHRKRLLETDDFQTFQLRLVKNDGGAFYVNLECNVVEESGSGPKQIRIVAVDITDRKKMEEELRRSRDNLDLQVQRRTAELKNRAEQLSRLSMEITLTEQRERRRIAQVLHDHLQQLLVAARIGQEVVVSKMDDALKPDAERVLGLISQSITDTRSLSTELAPPVLRSSDLTASFRWLARWMHENQGFDIKLESEEQIELESNRFVVLLFQSVRELLLNVLKHAGVKSATLTMKKENGYLGISVMDRGVGFNPETVWKNENSDRKFGLITIRERLLHLGGSLEIESRPNAGATISLIVPLDKERPAKKEFPGCEIHGTPVSALTSAQQLTGKISVLIADDHPVMRDGLSRMLSSHPDIEVLDQASNGREAVQLAREIVPDVILMDISMPIMDGLEAIRIIHSEFPHIRIIGLSMYDEDDQAEASLNAGAVAYLSKSQNIDLILSTIRGEV